MAMSSAACSEIMEEEAAAEALRPAIFNRLTVKVKPEGQHSHSVKADPEATSKAPVRTLAYKNACKRPVSVGPSAPGSTSEISESAVSLKQALRRLCISQASELAAMKRMSKPASVATASQVGASSKLHPLVLVPAGYVADDMKGNAIKGLLLKPVTVKPEIVGTEEVEKINGTSTKIAGSASTEAQKLTIQDVITQKLSQPSKSSSAAMTREKKDESASKVCAAHAVGTAASADLSGGPCMAKPVSKNETFVKKKVRTDLPTPAPCKSCQNGTPVSLASRIKSFLQEPLTPKIVRSAVDIRGNSTPSKPLPVYDKCIGRSPISSKSNELSSSKEKGECSQSSKSSIGDYSSSTSISDESYNSFSRNSGKPHMCKDIKWVAVRRMVMQYGGLDLKYFKLLKRLGSGDIGTVYLAELVGSNCLFALKVMDVDFLIRRKKMLRAQTERDILQMLDHPFLPTLYSHFTTDNLSCLVMEYCSGGDLHVLRQKQPSRRFSESAAQFYVAEVLLALEYLHMLGVIYRDLKPENILVRDDGHIMLSDFDLSLRCSVSPMLIRSPSVCAEEPARPSGPCPHGGCMDPLCIQSTWPQPSCFTPRIVPSRPQRAKVDSSKQQPVRLPQLVVEPTDARSNSFVGTHEYLAPEIIRGDGHGSSVDWWTLGIFLYELLYGRTPFKGPGTEETMANVVTCGLKFPDEPAVSPHAKDLIRGLLVKQPEDRLGSVRGAAEIKRHPFFQGLNWALIRCAAPPGSARSPDVGAAQTKKERKCRQQLGSHGSDVELELF